MRSPYAKIHRFAENRDSTDHCGKKNLLVAAKIGLNPGCADNREEARSST
jgi:hypothetical protein